MYNYDLNEKELEVFDVAVIGGGVAGTFAAVSAARSGAKVIIIERSGSFGGTLTEGFIPRMMDSKNKGGLVRELFDFLDARQMSGVRSGKRDPKTGKLLPGDLVDTEACKYFFDKLLMESGVKIMLYSQVAAVKMNGDKIESVLVVSELANFSLRAKIFIDATGNGNLAAMAGCKWDFGEPDTREPQPVSVNSCILGMHPDYNGTTSNDEKTEYGNRLKAHGIEVSAAQANLAILPSCKSWAFSCNFGYNVAPDDTEKLTECTVEGRRELFDTIEAHKKIEGYENLHLAFTSAHIGIREGRRIYGEYRITDSDILEGRRFDDGVCLVTLGVDVHKINKDDTTDTARGFKSKPFNIPYRAMLPLSVDNLILSGRCISGDFYPHAAYRYMGDMSAVGEASGYAAARCVKDGVSPRGLDGKEVSSFMRSRKYEI